MADSGLHRGMKPLCVLVGSPVDPGGNEGNVVNDVRLVVIGTVIGAVVTAGLQLVGHLIKGRTERAHAKRQAARRVVRRLRRMSSAFRGWGHQVRSGARPGVDWVESVLRMLDLSESQTAEWRALEDLSAEAELEDWHALAREEVRFGRDYLSQVRPEKYGLDWPNWTARWTALGDKLPRLAKDADELAGELERASCGWPERMWGRVYIWWVLALISRMRARQSNGGDSIDPRGPGRSGE